MPDAPGLELIAQEINKGEPGTVTETALEHDRATLVVNSRKVLWALRYLRDEPKQQYRFLSSLHAADYLPAEPRFAVHYELLNMDRVERVNVKALLHDPSASTAASSGHDRQPQAAAGRSANGVGHINLPVIDSCVELFPTANYQEREAYDFFGIRFTGHPDLTRILMPDDYVGWPQRRDFPVGGEPVIFTKDEPDNPGWYE
jgi:NADH-quinone oxidoreductase subunit C